MTDTTGTLAPQVRVKAAPPELVSERVIRFVASDETPDRMGDVIAVNGWNLTSYKQNPVVLWGHDQTTMPPIGKATNVYRGVGPGGKPALMSSIEFAPAETYEFAETVYQLAKGGYLNAVSVGFLPRETKELDEKERRSLGMPSHGVYYTAADLLEISVVSVPANPSALATGAKSLVHQGVLQQREVDRFLKATPMTEEELAERLKSKIRGFIDLGALAKAKPDALKVGDMVSWDSSGGRARGKIERIERDGTISVPDSSFTVSGTAEDPAALIRIYRGDDPTDTLVGHKFSTLTKLKGYDDMKEDEKQPKAATNLEAKAVKPGQIKVGDMVSCMDDDDERGYGRVERIKYEGRMQNPDTKEMTEASPENPAALVNMVDEKMNPMDKRVVRRFADLKRVKMMEEEDEDKMEAEEGHEEEKGLELTSSLPESVRKHIQSAYTEDGQLVVAFDLAMMEEGDDLEAGAVEEKALESDTYTGLVAAQTEQTKALTTLIDSISDLTKRIHAMSEVRGGSPRQPDAKPSDAHERAREEKQLQQLTEDFLGRIKRMR